MGWGLGGGGGGYMSEEKLLLGVCFEVFVLCVFFKNLSLLCRMVNCSCVSTQTSLSLVFFFLRFCCDGCENEVGSQQQQNSRLPALSSPR